MIGGFSEPNSILGSEINSDCMHQICCFLNLVSVMGAFLVFHRSWLVVRTICVFPVAGCFVCSFPAACEKEGRKEKEVS